MTFDQFLDAIVQLAVIKYPSEIEAGEALFRLYNERLSSFSSPDSFATSELDTEALKLIGSCQKTLLALYTGYFPHELNPRFVERFTTVDSMSKKAFLELYTDYEVCPSLISKACVLQVYRDVMTNVFLPSGLESVAKNAGTHFSFFHFLISTLELSRRIFPDLLETDSVRLLGVLTHMDQSPGRATARMKQLKTRVPDKLVSKEFSKQQGEVRKEAKMAERALPERKMEFADVPTAVVNDPGLLELLSHFELGMKAQFHHYQSADGLMSLEGFCKFLKTNRIRLDNPEPVFAKCSLAVGSMRMDGFRLAVLMVASAFGDGKLGMKERVVKLFEHMNSVSSVK